MLLFLISKRKPSSAFLPLFTAHRCCSATSIQNPDPEPSKSPNFSVVDYLVASFGFSSEAALVRAFKINRGLVAHDISTSIQPKISILQRHGLSNHDIGRNPLKIPRFFISSVSAIEDTLNRAKEMGFQPESGMFINAMRAIKGISRDMMQKKMNLLKGFGWSQDDLFSALQKCPSLLELSQKNLKVTMDFLMESARCDSSYVASHPLLLKYSIEKRLRPRQDVLCILESKGISGKAKDYHSIMTMTDGMFVERFILPNKDIAGLFESYRAACGRESTPFKNIEVVDSILDTNGEC